MKTFTEANYREARKNYLEQVAWMHQKNLGDADRQGGVDYLRANATLDAAKRFLGIERRLITLAAFDDAAEQYIAELSQVIEAQFATIHQLNAELKRTQHQEHLEPAAHIDFRSYLLLMLHAKPVPTKVGALLDLREGKREAARQYAITTQPNLF